MPTGTRKRNVPRTIRSIRLALVTVSLLANQILSLGLCSKMAVLQMLFEIIEHIKGSGKNGLAGNWMSVR